MTSPSILLIMREASDKSCRENPNTHFMKMMNSGEISNQWTLPPSPSTSMRFITFICKHPNVRFSWWWINCSFSNVDNRPGSVVTTSSGIDTDCSRLLSLGDLMAWKMVMSPTKEIYTKQWNTFNESFMNRLIREGTKQKPVEYWQQSKRRWRNAQNKNNIDNYWKYYSYRGNAVAQWLTCCATNRKVAGVIGIFHWHNPMALGSIQSLTEMSTRSISWGENGRCLRLITLPPFWAIVK